MSDDTTLRKGPASSRGPEQSVVLYHRGGTKVAPLPVGATLVVGRAWPADVVVDDRSLSRRHASFTATVAGVEVEDLESTNGTWVNGAMTKRASLAPGDEVRLGDVTACVHVAPWRGAPAAGLDGNDRFLQVLADEVVRARSFGRPLSIAMVRGAPGPRAHVRHWEATLTAMLRPVDHAALFAEDTISLTLPELGAGDAARLAARIEAALPGAKVGVASHPDDGTSADELVAAVRRALRGVRASVPPESGGVDPVALGPRMRALLDGAARVAESALPVLVLGETGSGKEVVARWLHARSPRAAGVLRSVNCAAIPQTLLEATLFGHEKGAFTGADRQTKGVFEIAHRGTVLLDEVGELTPAAQAALLRVLETKRLTRVGGHEEVEVDVRVVAATHRDLEAMAASGAFRRDLLFRLNAVTLEIPPLRDRHEELEPLVRAFVEEANRANGRRVTRVSPAAWELLRRWSWPGNVRELKNTIERAVVIARTDEITDADLPERLRAPVAGLEPDVLPADDGALGFKERVRDHMARYESELIVDALRRADGNQTQAARLLGIPLRTLTHKMQVLGIKKRYG